MKAFSIGDVTAEPGSLAKGKLGSIYLADGTEVSIPIMVLNGAQEGPVLWLSSAMHGQEIGGTGAIWEVMNKQIDPAKLRGTVVGAPVLNPLSFNGGTYFTPQDGYNINRVFPGDPHGLLTSRMAALVLEEGIKKVDYVVDFHANPEPALFFSIIKQTDDAEVWEKSRAMAEAFGITFMEMVLKFEAHRTGTMTDTALKLGKPAITVELVPWRRMTPLGIRVGALGIVNIMKKLGMVDGEIEPQTEVLVIRGKLTRTETTATRGGVIKMYREPGDPVKKGEIVGHIVNLYGEPVEDIASPVDGWLMAFPMLDNQAAGTGDLVAFYLFEKPA